MDYKDTKTFWDAVFKAHPFNPPKNLSTGIKPLDDAVDWLKKSPQNVLDFGFGSGLLLLMSAKDTQGFFHGIDISLEACTFAKKLFAHYQIKNARFETGSLDQLKKAKTNHYDSVILSNVIDNLWPEDALALLDEVKRILKDQGKVLLKLNDHLTDDTIKQQSLILKQKDFYLDDQGIYLWNLPTETWLKTLDKTFDCLKQERIFIPKANQYNRLFLLKKKI